MTTFKITEDLTLEAKSFSTRNSWGHEVTAIYKGQEINTQKTYYINRTWERYQYESALNRMIDVLDKEKKVPLRDRFQATLTIKNR
jgi:hypothetical protein